MVLQKGTLFDPVLVTDLISRVQGKSSLAKLSQQTPIPFNGLKEFVFTMDNEIDVVAESGSKSEGGVDLSPRVIIPIKFEYGARISDEFLYASEEEQINILKAFNEGFAKKVARGLDLAAFHGVNPRTGQASDVIGNNCFDKLVTQKVEAETGLPDPNADVETAIAMIQAAEADVTG
ncbi:MAG: phage major capsid protein, partial [Tissierellales bacterium]